MTSSTTPEGRDADGITTDIDDHSVSATTVVEASPAEVFSFIRRPANHAQISGDETVRGIQTGPEQLGPDSRFGMKMKLGVPYRITSKVVEFDENRVIAWCHGSGHRWRWELEPVGDTNTKLTETYDQSTAKLPFVLRLMGYPKRHRANVVQSVANVAAYFAGAGTRG